MFQTAKALFGILTGKGGVKAQGRGVSVLDQTVRDAHGQSIPMARYRGQVLMLVNVASKCGCTPQYHDLVALDKSYRDRGLVVLGFPCNDFAGQEPGSNETIASFCSSTYGVDFPIFDKVRVKGAEVAPLYASLIAPANAPFDGAIGWNFTKFLVGRDGTVRARVEPGVKPNDPKVISIIETLLNERA